MNDAYRQSLSAVRLLVTRLDPERVGQVIVLDDQAMLYDPCEGYDDFLVGRGPVRVGWRRDDETSVREHYLELDVAEAVLRGTVLEVGKPMPPDHPNLVVLWARGREVSGVLFVRPKLAERSFEVGRYDRVRWTSLDARELQR